jgi:hypothetical protein
MISRTILAALALATTVTAWPILFYPTQGCHGEPVAVLHEPKALTPGKCGFFHEYVKSYSGATDDEIQSNASFLTCINLSLTRWSTLRGLLIFRP